MNNILINQNLTSYDDFFKKIESHLNRSDYWNSTIPSETGNLLISLFASLGVSMDFFSSRRLQESFLETAQSPLGVMTCAKMLSGSLQSKNPTVSNISYTRKTPSSGLSYTIPKFSKWSVSGSEFYNNSNIHVSSSQDSGSFELIEGTEVVKTFTSDGTSTQKLYMSDSFKSGRFLRVFATDYITGIETEWLLVDSLIEGGYTTTSDSQNLTIVNPTTTFETAVIQDGTVQVKFGDGYFGHIPVKGSTITVKYYEVSGGSLNSISPVNSPVSLVSSVSTFNIDNFLLDIDSFTCTAMSSGQGEPSYFFYKSHSPSNFGSRLRHVSDSDLNAALLNFSYSDSNFRPIKAVICRAERSSSSPNPLLANTVVPIVIMDASTFLSDTFKYELSKYLSLTSVYSVVVPVLAEIVPLELNIILPKDTNGISIGDIRNSINSALYDLVKIRTIDSPTSSETLFNWIVDNADNSVLGKTYFLSDFYEVVSKATGGLKCDISLNFRGETKVIKLEEYEALGLDFNDPDSITISFI